VRTCQLGQNAVPVATRELSTLANPEFCEKSTKLAQRSTANAPFSVSGVISGVDFEKPNFIQLFQG
jgi:hypothetical protein